MIRIIGYFLFVVAILNTIILAFAYRDFSLALLAMTLLSVLGIPLALYLIAKFPELHHWFVSEDDEGNRWHFYREDHKDLDLEDSELSRGFFESCR